MPKQDFYEISARFRAQFTDAELREIDAQVAAELAVLSIAIAIRRARKKAGMTQIELAAATDITQAQISRIERGEYEPRLDTLSRIATALNTKFVIGPREDTARTPAA